MITTFDDLSAEKSHITRSAGAYFYEHAERWRLMWTNDHLKALDDALFNAHAPARNDTGDALVVELEGYVWIDMKR